MKRRGLLEWTTMGVAVAGFGAATATLFKSMEPDATTSVLPQFKLNEIAEGHFIVVTKNGNLYVIRHRTMSEMMADSKGVDRQFPDELARNINLPSNVKASIQNRTIPIANEFAIYSGLCSHDPCVLDDKFRHLHEDAVWSCPCCGSEYDSCGRFLRGLGVTNLSIPNYRITEDRILTLL